MEQLRCRRGYVNEGVGVLRKRRRRRGSSGVEWLVGGRAPALSPRDPGKHRREGICRRRAAV